MAHTFSCSESCSNSCSDGKIKHFTGVSAPYEAPLNPEIHIETDILVCCSENRHFLFATESLIAFPLPHIFDRQLIKVLNWSLTSSLPKRPWYQLIKKQKRLAFIIFQYFWLFSHPVLRNLPSKSFHNRKNPWKVRGMSNDCFHCFNIIDWREYVSLALLISCPCGNL